MGLIKRRLGEPVKHCRIIVKDELEDWQKDWARNAETQTIDQLKRIADSIWALGSTLYWLAALAAVIYIAEVKGRKNSVARDPARAGSVGLTNVVEEKAEHR